MSLSQHVQKISLGLLFSGLLCSLGGVAGAAAPAKAPAHWVASWGSAQMVPEGNNLLPAAGWRDASLRQIVRVSLGGEQLRVRLSNAFGSAPLLVEAASVAVAMAPGRADIDPATLRPLRFNGRATVMIPAGAEYDSDPVTLVHKAGTDLAVSLYFKDEPARQTGHPGSRTTTFTAAGNQVDAAAWQDAGKVVRWYQLSGIEVLAPRTVGALAVVGDSITDGYGTTTDGNDRWTDVLVRGLGGRSRPLAVINGGIGGGRLLRDGLGPNLAARFERDVLGRGGVTHALVQIGVNDLGGQHRSGDDSPAARAAMLEDLKGAHRQLVARAHARGVCMIGATVTPYTGSDYYKPNADNEADRQSLNAWIRTAGVYDMVADFDAALRDPADPSRMRAELDSGDHLHPSLAGYRAMAAAVLPLKFEGCKPKP